MRRRQVARSSLGLVILLILVGIVASQGWFLVEIPLGDSEWAFEDTGLRELADEGYDGSGVRVCVVDTGVDTTHSALEGQRVEFRDFVGSSTEPLDRGATAHGTMMVGLMVADGHQKGAVPGITLGVAAALSGDVDGDNTGDDLIVAEAIDWCRTGFDADLI
jgi:serine protease AprX